MSFSDLQINPLLITELYNNLLVDLPQHHVKNTESFTFLGGNEKRIIILVNDANAVTINDDDLNLLTGILHACKLTLADTAIINTFEKKITYFDIQQQLEPRSVIFFGIDLQSVALPLHFPHFQVQQYNQQSFLAAPALQILARDIPAKKQLWTNLQKMFF